MALRRSDGSCRTKHEPSSSVQIWTPKGRHTIGLPDDDVQLLLVKGLELLDRSQQFPPRQCFPTGSLPSLLQIYFSIHERNGDGPDVEIRGIDSVEVVLLLFLDGILEGGDILRRGYLDRKRLVERLTDDPASQREQLGHRREWLKISGGAQVTRCRIPHSDSDSYDIIVQSAGVVQLTSATTNTRECAQTEIRRCCVSNPVFLLDRHRRCSYMPVG